MSGKVKAFNHFGVKLKNSRWSWSGRAADGRVVLCIWKKQLDYKINPPRIDIVGDARLTEMFPKLGNKERIDNLKWTRDNSDGLFQVVIAIDTIDRPWVINEAYPTKIVMRLIYFDEISEIIGVLISYFFEISKNHS